MVTSLLLLVEVLVVIQHCKSSHECCFFVHPTHTHMMFSASIAFRDVFKAACCLYGVSDITLLAKETHKFESRYPGKNVLLQTSLIMILTFHLC